MIFQEILTKALGINNDVLHLPKKKVSPRLIATKTSGLGYGPETARLFFANLAGLCDCV
jgi:hypothetical protein